MDEQTQQSTQEIFDPRRLGRNNSGLNENDVSDVICILYPSSPSAYQVVVDTAKAAPQHVLSSPDSAESFVDTNGQETFILDDFQRETAQRDGRYRSPHAIALRFSSRTVDPCMGFQFGRNSRVCDVNLGADSVKRVSNKHFRIYLTDDGIIMLQDISTNGTLVNDVYLKRRSSTTPATRMLENGSMIQLSISDDEMMKFILRMPSRDGHLDEYERRFRAYMDDIARAARLKLRVEAPPQAGPNFPVKALALPGPAVRGPIRGSPLASGLLGKGGERYNLVAQIGKGAFATVYQAAAAIDGRLFAAKELDKGRFMKNGQMDQRLDNEMKIMKNLRHANIVEYVDYQEVDKYLYIIMEYVPFGDLQAHLQNHILSEAHAKLMARQVLGALDYLHQKNITHRDIKPDNILIACYDPFKVKLSDFGLSKVVKNEETFLKTFCGTLLYCAPEVFPHYDSHATGARAKRRRVGGSSAPKFHSYSQSVDIWSFGAVLWFSMCGVPPFEGVQEPAGGRGMFDKIMGTPLFPSALREKGISETAIDLLMSMLNTDPSKRPNERQCLRHPWLGDGRRVSGVQVGEDLQPIVEEELEAESGLSQLSIQEGQMAGSPAHGLPDVDFDSDDFDFFDPRDSKRARQDRGRSPDSLPPTEGVDLDSSFNHPSSDRNNSSSPVVAPHSGQPGRLFGEIGQSALHSSGVLDIHTQAALNLPSSYPPSDSGSNSPEFRRFASHSFIDETQMGDAPSLLGAESLVRELNMASPQSGLSPAGSSNEPQTPVTPSSLEGDSDNHDETPKMAQASDSDATPKQPVLNRQINLPRQSLFQSSEMMKGSEEISLPATETGSQYDDEEVQIPTRLTSPHPSQLQAENSQFLRPPALLGTLTSTPNSFANIILRLEDRITKWGRHPANNIVYPHKNDIRVPKVGLVIWFHAIGIERVEEEGGDWTKMKGLYTGISTMSRAGISVNGVRLKERTDDGTPLYGRLYTGDVITVAREETDGGLHFICKFHHGEAAEPRPEGSSFDVLKTET